MSRQSLYKSLLLLALLSGIHFAVTDAHQSFPSRSSELLAPRWSFKNSRNSKLLFSADTSSPPRRQTALMRQMQIAPGRNVCLQESTLKEILECFQQVLEMYYGPLFTVYCPEASRSIVPCTGCPWDFISPELRHNNSIPLPAEYFQKAEPSCKVADILREYKNPHILVRYVVFAGIHVSLLLAILSVFGVSSGSKNGIMSPVTLLNWKVPEVLYLAALWLVYITTHIITVSSRSYYVFCESFSTSVSYGVVALIAYATVLFISASRCLKLSSGPKKSDDDAEESSWLSFISGVVWGGDESRSRSSVLVSLTVFLALLLLIVVLVVDYRVPYRIGRESDATACNAGHKNLALGFIQISKKVLEILCVLVYASGVQRGRWRRASLFLIMMGSWALLFSMIPSSGPYKQLSMSMTIPRTLDSAIAFGFVEIAHITFVATLGILEPFRTKMRKTNDPVEV